MASWSDNIYSDNDTIRSNLISGAYAAAIITFSNAGIDPLVFRDLEWNGSDIIRKSDSLSSGSFSEAQKLKYFPQLVQLVDIGSKRRIYP